MSQRLTVIDRDQIIRKAMEFRFTKEDEAISEATKTLALQMYENHFSEQQREAMNSFPPGWMHERISIHFNDFGNCRYLDLPKPVRVPHDSVLQRINITPAFSKKLAALDAKHKALEELQREVRSHLKSLVYSVSTFAALRKAWPEGEQFFPVIGVPTTALTIPVEQLNKALRLK